MIALIIEWTAIAFSICLLYYATLKLAMEVILDILGLERCSLDRPRKHRQFHNTPSAGLPKISALGNGIAIPKFYPLYAQFQPSVV